jgi:putative peptide modification system cyclase
MNLIARTASEGPQLRTLLLTDLVDSTSLVERLGDIPASELFREHDRLVLKLQEQWRGRLIDRSDGLLLLFERPIDGLGFALDYARGLHEMGKARGHELQARAGLHVGEVLTWKNSEAAVSVGAKPLEVEGLAKPMAARIMTLARPGQILLSAMAEPLARRAARELGERGENLLWKSYGRWRFKGVPESHEIFEVGEVGIAPLRAPANMPKAWRDIPLWRRPAALAAEVVLLAGLGVGIWFMTKPQPAIAFSERDWVVVGDLRNLTGEKVLDDSLAQAFRISLEQSRYVNVLSDMKARDTLARMQRKPGTVLDRAIASEIAIRDGARAVILPTVAEVGGRVRVSAEVIDPYTQTTVYAESADGVGAGSTLESIDKVTATLRGSLGEALASIEKDSAPLPQVTTRNLDALRAYALGVKATGNRQWDEATKLFERAIALDDRFALAYMGLVRLHWSAANYDKALPLMRKALSLRSSLPQRDQLYLDAWMAETSGKGSPLEAWKMLATMYPDYFAGASNASWYLFVENRFAEALGFARAAAVPQDPLRSAPLEHIGRIHVAQGRPDEALASLLLAEEASDGKPTRYRADALALAGRYDEAWAMLDAIPKDPAAPSSLYSNLERISIAVDQGRLDHAAENAKRAMASAARFGAIEQQRFAVVEQMVNYLRDPESVSPVELARLLADAESGFNESESLQRRERAYGLLAAVYLAQRSGHGELAQPVIKRIMPALQAMDSPGINKMAVIVEATQARLDGDPQRAIQMLAGQLDGHELVQTHTALFHAYQAAGQHDKAIQHANWLAANRGRAYVEFNLEQSLQPLNVADTRLAHLWASESHVLAKEEKAAATRRAAFVQAWPASGLPDYLRRRL